MFKRSIILTGLFKKISRRDKLWVRVEERITELEDNTGGFPEYAVLRYKDIKI